MARCYCLAVFLFVFHTVTANVFTAGDKTINVLEGGPLLVPFKPVTVNITMASCYFEYTTLEGIQEEEFVGYNIKDQERLEMTNRHLGWDFINEKYPCTAGIKRDVARTTDEGRYRMFINNADSQYVSAYTAVQLFKETDLKISVKMGKDGSKNEYLLKDLRMNNKVMVEFPPIKGVEATDHEISIQLSEKFPPDTEISFSKVSKDAHAMEDKQFTSHCNNERYCSMTYSLGEESDVVVTATLNTSLQDYPTFVFEQPYDYNGINKTSGHKAAIAFVVLFFIAIVLLVVFCIKRKVILKKIRRLCQTWKGEKNDVAEEEGPLDKDDPEKREMTLQIQDLHKENANLKNEISDLKMELQIRKSAMESEVQQKLREALAKRKKDEEKWRTALMQNQSGNEKLVEENRKLKEENDIRRKQLQEKGQPDFVEDPQSVVVGDQKEVTIKAIIIGNGTSVNWKKDQTINVNNPSYKDYKTKKGRRTASHEGDEYTLIVNVAPKDYGEYLCVARNKQGSATRMFSIKK